jgi:hypothetical protein
MIGCDIIPYNRRLSHYRIMLSGEILEGKLGGRKAKRDDILTRQFRRGILAFPRFIRGEISLSRAKGAN